MTKWMEDPTQQLSSLLQYATVILLLLKWFKNAFKLTQNKRNEKFNHLFIDLKGYSLDQAFAAPMEWSCPRRDGLLTMSLQSKVSKYLYL